MLKFLTTKSLDTPIKRGEYVNLYLIESKYKCIEIWFRYSFTLFQVIPWLPHHSCSPLFPRYSIGDHFCILQWTIYTETKFIFASPSFLFVCYIHHLPKTLYQPIYVNSTKRKNRNTFSETLHSFKISSWLNLTEQSLYNLSWASSQIKGTGGSISCFDNQTMLKLIENKTLQVYSMSSNASLHPSISKIFDRRPLLRSLQENNWSSVAIVLIIAEEK